MAAAPFLLLVVGTSKVAGRSVLSICVRPSSGRHSAVTTCTPSCESSASAAGMRAKCNVDKDDDDCQKSKTSHSHHAGMRNRSRSLRLDPGHCGYGGDDDCEAEPYEPVHDSACYKIRASRARSEIRRVLGSSSFTCCVSLGERVLFAPDLRPNFSNRADFGPRVC